MLDIRYLRDNPDEAEARLHTRGEAVGLAPFRALDARRRELLGESETLKAERNSVSALIGRTKDKSKVQDEIVRMKAVSARIKELDDDLRQVEDDLRGLLLTVPNLPDAACPVGSTEADNPEVRRWGTPRTFDFEPKAHWDLGESLGDPRFRTRRQAGRRAFQCRCQGRRAAGAGADQLHARSAHRR